MALAECADPTESQENHLADAPAIELEDALEQLHAVHCATHAHFLRILGEYDAQKGWATDHAPSAEAWVRARVHVSIKTAREWVRAAAALRELPAIWAAYSEGSLSWEHVRELTKFATADTDGELAELARGWTAEAAAAAARRPVRWTACDGRGPRKARRVLVARRQVAHVPPARSSRPRRRRDRGDSPRPVIRQTTKGHQRYFVPGHIRLADALVELASTKLVEEQDADRAVVVVHVGAEVLARGEGWLMRQVRRRDQGCRFPGCGRKRLLHAHHIATWPKGPTDLDNLTALCRFHHQLVHEKDWKVRGSPNGRLEFIRPDGRPYADSPRPLRPEVRRRIPLPGPSS